MAEYKPDALQLQFFEKIGRENIDRIILLSFDFTRAHQTATECIDAIRNIFDFELKEMKALSSDNMEPVKSNNGLDTGLTMANTAVSQYLHKLEIVIRKELRERYFRKLNATVLIIYNKIWPINLVRNSRRRICLETHIHL